MVFVLTQKNLTRKYSLLVFLILVFSQLKAQQTIVQYLSGIDKDHLVNWDFYINTGQKSGAWYKIGVPSNWEQQGFGTYNYYRDTKNPKETGNYKYHFFTPASYSGKHIFIVFEASMTDTEVKINGLLAGPVHQGGFYRFKYEVTQLLHLGSDNLLEVRVSKKSANESVNKAERKADFWLFGGIFRPVYLEVLPQSYIDRIAVDAKADGSLKVNVFTNDIKPGYSVNVQVQYPDGRNIGLPFFAKASVTGRQIVLNQHVNNIKPWNPESPNLYKVVVTLSDHNSVIHKITQRIGFRTTELRLNDGFYVNGKKVVFKGVNRHSEWPETGRALSKGISLLDVGLIKEMNMNAVRMSHYPPDQHFLDVCDSLGLFVLDELTGWQDKYDTEIGKKLVKELVVRDVNHPCVVIWDNGNEGGFNTDLDNEYAKYDPQNRLVIHPWERFNGTDTKHYPDYSYIVNTALYGKDVFFPTEFMHGLEDGGQGAGLDDFWSLMRTYPHLAGGFLWSFHDEGVARTDRNGEIDIQGNAAPDGILGPHREKEASFYTIKQIWSPVIIDQKDIPDKFDGRISVENNYIYTNLNTCQFKWKLVSLHSPNGGVQKTDAEGSVKGIDLEPGAKGFLQLKLPTIIPASDVLYLTAFDAFKKEIFTWSWPLKSPRYGQLNGGNRTEIRVTEGKNDLEVKQGKISYCFDETSGYLQKVVTVKGEVSLSGGPALAGVNCTLKSFKHYLSGDDYIVEPVYESNAGYLIRWIFSPGKLPQLSYQFNQKGEFNYSGITFKFPEKLITGMEWEGRGPYRVWKNRLKGQQFGVWHNDYNNTITGESWKYPEFKGFYSELYWVKVENKQSAFTVYTGQKGTFLQMLKPNKPGGATNDYTNPPFPDSDLGFLNTISPIGTKFQPAEKLGPQSQKNMQLNYTPVKGVLWFDFR